MSNPIQSSHVVITGGSSGIGLEVARLSIAGGASKVTVLGRSAEKLKQAIQLLGPKCEVAVLDVTDEMAVAAALSKVGRFDHLVTAAAGTYRGKLIELDTSKAKALFESKFWGQHHCAKYGAPRINEGGSITLFSGWISRKPMNGTRTLAAIDGAIESLARVLALELAPIRVNTIVPGMIDTPLWSARLNAEQQREHFAKIANSLPVQRVGTATDVAEAVCFLMANRFTTGALIDVDGGQGFG